MFFVFICELHEPLQYSREFLPLLRNSGVCPVNPLVVFPAEVIWSDSTAVKRGWVSKVKRVRKRGSRGGGVRG